MWRGPGQRRRASSPRPRPAEPASEVGGVPGELGAPVRGVPERADAGPDAAGPGLTRARRVELEDELFRERDGKQLGRALAESVQWDQLHTFAVGVRGATERDWLRRAYAAVEAEHPGAPADELVLRFAWGKLRGGAAPGTVRDYVGRLLRALQADGVRGLRTARVLGVQKALTRFTIMLRPRQAPPVDTPVVLRTVRSLQEAGHEGEAACVALTWVTRARLADVRYTVVADVAEVLTDDGTGLEVSMREKQALAWRPVVWVPPGPLTEVVRGWLRTRRQAGARELFCATEGEYAGLRRRVRAALPEGSWTHSLRRGSAQVCEEDGASLEELRDLLRHASSKTTRRYLQSTSTAQRKREARLTDGLQHAYY